METQVDSQKIIPYNSSLRISDQLFKEYYWKEYEAIFIYVNNPPKELTPESYRDLRQMIGEFETMPRALGNASTVLWLNYYEMAMKPYYDVINFFDNDFPLDYQELPVFLADNLTGPIWSTMIKWHTNGEKKVEVNQFYFVTGIHNATTWVQRAENMLE